MPTSSTKQESQTQTKTLALFLSDIHLSENLPRTTERFLSFLQTQAIHTERLYLLGDLFEYWAGDDDSAAPYNQRIVDALRKLSDAGVELFWIAGNRDFLVGEEFAALTGAKRLNDPSTLHLADKDFIIAHGDALCTDDVDYMAFRSMVRQSAWQSQFLAKPLAERKAIIAAMRQASSSEQQNKSMAIMDVNQAAVSQLCQKHPGSTLIHGHTHRTALHQEAHGLRYVLPDWDCDHAPKIRGGWLSLFANGNLEFNYL